MRRSKIHSVPVISRQIYYYKDGNNEFQEITGTIKVGLDEFNYIIGVVIDNLLRPAVNSHYQIIMIRLGENHSYPIPRQLLQNIPFGRPPHQISEAIIANNI